MATSCCWGPLQLGWPVLACHQAPDMKLLDSLDPQARLKEIQAEACTDTRPVSFHFVPATALWSSIRFGGYDLKTHQDISQVPWLGILQFVSRAA